jgi:hypothetical protein
MMLSEAIVIKINALWKSASGLLRYDKPVLPMFFKSNGDPAFVSANDRLPTSSVIESLPEGFATSEKQDAANNLLNSINNALATRYSAVQQLFKDSSSPASYFIRHELINLSTGSSTISFTLPDGTVATPVYPIVPAVSASDFPFESQYDVMSVTEGYSYQNGDRLHRAIIKNGLTTVAEFWLNLSTNPSTVVSAVNLADLEPGSETINVKGIGEIQPNPTPNTVLARLKDLLTGIVLAAGNNFIGFITPKMTSGGNISLTTSGGAGYVAFASQDCLQVTIVNNSGAEILCQQSGSGVGLPLMSDTYYTFYGISNANQIAVKRTDNGTAVAIAARWES